jgi:hypothetical protein
MKLMKLNMGGGDGLFSALLVKKVNTAQRYKTIYIRNLQMFVIN